MLRRRFVNLVAQNSDGVYSLRRIEAAKHLFYPSIKEAEESANDEKKKYKTLRRLPDPITSFDPSPVGVLFPGLEWFELLAPRSGEGRIVNSNKAGHTAMFDADKSLYLALPNLSQAKGTSPVSFSVTHPGSGQDSLYVLHRYPGQAVAQARFVPDRSEHPRSCFEVLEYKGLSNDGNVPNKGWDWRLLPPPPFVREPGYQPSMINSHTTIKDANGCTTICISSDKIGTHCFDTWCFDSTHHLRWKHLDVWKQVGEWELPFYGRAEHVPELGIWLGFTAGRKPHHLCAVDLSTMDMDGQAPTWQHVWDNATLPGEKNWYPLFFRLINMGDNRFCVAKLFGDVEMGKQFAVLTGIEMERGQDGLRMVQHKRTRYVFNRIDVKWVL
ncbi:uncharacterized protein LOC119362670 [Triticum dicoccoides]|uniref:uncharacterized protein LOC119362670 n=1 Tax=Triticum dicoccoides TaxID=85692 RepID=UPI0018908CAC|nr:uncharacterized protein LOC119362670 [Triticum dicoccoides]